MDVTYRFNGFEVDPLRRVLFGPDGQPIPLKPRVFDTLIYLIEHRGELLEKQVLLDAIWPHVIVEENNLNQAISTLRRVFGETRGEHRFIVTEPGRGYRFVARVEVVPLESPGARTMASTQLAAPMPSGPDSLAIPESAVPGDGEVLSARRLRTAYVAMAALFVALGAALFWFSNRGSDVRWLHEELIPKVEMHLDLGDWEAAYTLTVEAQQRVPDHPELLELWPRFSWLATLESDPPGATVSRRAYGATNANWQELGRTPLRDIRIPFGLSQLHIELEGHEPLLRTIGGGLLVFADLADSPPAVPELGIAPELYKLDTLGSLPSDMVRVAGWSSRIGGEPVPLGDYFLGRHEVTNAEFKRFVDEGGYRKPSFWAREIVRDGEVVPFEEAMTLFVDRNGRPGPSTWGAGDYPVGHDNFPVSGVSWYEADAYARFMGRELPTVHHWRRAQPLVELPWVLPLSNFEATGAVPVEQSGAMNYSGTFDMTGNVREWTATALGNDRRVILGGAWTDPPSEVTHRNNAASPLDRSESNGLRLALTQDEPAVARRAQAPLRPPAALTPTQQLPVSDEAYAGYSRAFVYDLDAPLRDSIEAKDTTRLWTRERIEFDAAYGGERMVLYLYLPTSGSPPYQTVIYWPGGAAQTLKSIDRYSQYLDFILTSGRAVAFPVYKGTFERGGGTPPPLVDTTAYRQNVIETVNDLRRSIDYLGTRPDIDRGSIAYFGHSWGGSSAPIVLAQEDRIRTAIIHVPFLLQIQNNPEVDPVNALPRVRVPVLMFSSEFDGFVPLDNAKRYFDLLGTPENDKQHRIERGSHFVPRDVLIRETRKWLDDHLG
jgi:DNA-binding winged helix-turn-helix (wHTH) protein/dienelactone hydrolase